MTPCDYFDSIVVIFLILGVFWGAVKGFISSFAVLLATFLGVVSIHRFRESAIQFLSLEPTQPTLCVVSFIIFALTSMIVYQLAHRLESFIQRRRLETWNRILGLIFGFTVSACGCWVGAWILTEFPQTRTSVTHSRSAKYLVLLAELGEESFPLPENVPQKTSFAEYPTEFIERVKEDAKLPPQNEIPEEENTGVHRFLDTLDRHVSEILCDVNAPPDADPNSDSEKIEVPERSKR